MRFDNAEKEFIGKTIFSVEFSEGNKEQVQIHFDDGSTLIGTTYGDCCSLSWIEHITIPADISGAQLIGFDESFGSAVEKNCEHPHDIKDEDAWGVIQIYHTSIKTNRGEIILEYRNSSNGYYGGWLEWGKEI